MRDGTSNVEEWLEKFAYENPDAVLIWGRGGIRQAALVSVFYKTGWAWRDGAPYHPRLSQAVAPQRGGERMVSKNSWADPLSQNGEETLEGFLENNVAARSFLAALVHTLSMAKRPKSEAEEIVRRAAGKMYPDYVKRLRLLSALAVEGVKPGQGLENLAISKPADGCLLCSIPDSVGQDWRDLAAEALGLPKKIHERFGKETRKEVLEAQKWTDKMLKSLRRKAAPPLP